MRRLALLSGLAAMLLFAGVVLISQATVAAQDKAEAEQGIKGLNIEALKQAQQTLAAQNAQQAPQQAKDNPGQNQAAPNQNQNPNANPPAAGQPNPQISDAALQQRIDAMIQARMEQYLNQHLDAMIRDRVDAYVNQKMPQRQSPPAMASKPNAQQGGQPQPEHAKQAAQGQQEQDREWDLTQLSQKLQKAIDNVMQEERQAKAGADKDAHQPGQPEQQTAQNAQDQQPEHMTRQEELQKRLEALKEHQHPENSPAPSENGAAQSNENKPSQGQQ